MIVVVGRLDQPRTALVAHRATARGARVEVVATAAPGAVGDRHLAELAAVGVGHAAVLRTPAASLGPADLELALRYLPDIGVVVVADDAAALGATAAAAAAWSGARLVLVATTDAADETPTTGVDVLPIVLEAPTSDPDGAFAGLVGALAVGLDGGADAAGAWAATLDALGIEPVGGSQARSVRPRRAAR
ncbi:MAG TPA: hypothetical protein VNH13_07260 [Candidatus Acidoferrales bacterium]|nr:hypothetical protein [Candidatus Acidoferrales bacterium]